METRCRYETHPIALSGVSDFVAEKKDWRNCKIGNSCSEKVGLSSNRLFGIIGSKAPIHSCWSLNRAMGDGSANSREREGVTVILAVEDQHPVVIRDQVLDGGLTKMRFRLSMPD